MGGSSSKASGSKNKAGSGKAGLSREAFMAFDWSGTSLGSLPQDLRRIISKYYGMLEKPALKDLVGRGFGWKSTVGVIHPKGKNYDTPYYGMAIGPCGHIFVTARIEVKVFHKTGGYIRSFASEGPDNGQLTEACGIAFDDRGHSAVIDRQQARVQFFYLDGKYEYKFGTFGNLGGRLSAPEGIVINTNKGHILIPDNQHRVQIFNMTGKWLQTIGNSEWNNAKYFQPHGIALDGDDRVLVSDVYGCGDASARICIFKAEDGKLSQDISPWNAENFSTIHWRPRGLAVDCRGDIVLADGDEGVKIFTREGKKKQGAIRDKNGSDYRALAVAIHEGDIIFVHKRVYENGALNEYLIDILS